MTSIFKIAALALATIAAAAALPATASARTLGPHQGRYMTLESAGPAAASPSSYGQLSLEDEDGGNAKNPALSAYQRGRGQETGGPARMLINR